jgi:transposase InsO family protein
MSETSSGDASASGYGVSNQLASLVPTFDPAKDDMTMYQQRVELVLAAWPKNRIQELVTRLILNCQGSAFQKLQLHHQELSSGDEKAVQKLIELLGGSWGRIALQKQYEEAEQALFHCSQRSDETNDSFLARADILWSRLMSRKLSWEDLQAFVLLRGSTLSPEEKKKVILDADSSASGKLTVSRVSDAIRLLGASFFGDMTGQKRSTKLKVYDNNAVLVAEDDEPADHPAFAAEETGEEEMFEQFLQEGDPDAALIADYEATAQDVLQEDSDLANAFSAYQEARQRLAEKQRHRGFWPPSRSMGSSSTSSWSKGKGRSYQQSFGKGKGSFTRPKRSLQDRIMSSTCRNCGRKGHWKAECPHKSDNQTSSAASMTTTAAATTSVAVSADDGMTLEFLQLPEYQAPTLDQETDSVPEAASFVGVGVNHQGSNKVREILGKSRDNLKAFMHATMTARQRLQQWGHRSEHHASVQVIRDQLRRRRGRCHPAVVQPSQCPKDNQQTKVGMTHNHGSSDTTALSYFATHGSFGILDLGASKTVIGTTQLASLINGLEPQVRTRLQRCPCNITFRFGNEGTLTSKQALVVPVGNKLLKIAIVEGGTPFLLSNALMRALEAKIDCQARKLISPVLSKPVDLQLTSKGLFLLDLNDLVQQSSLVDAPQPVTETFMSEEVKENVSPCSVSHLQVSGCQSEHAKSFVKPVTTVSPCHNHPPKDETQESSVSSISHQPCTMQPCQFTDKSKPSKQVQFDVNHSHSSNSQEPCLPSFTCDEPPRSVQHVRPDSQAESSPGSAGARSAVQSGPSDSARVGERGDLVWGGSHGPHVFPGVGGSRVGEIHDVPVSQELKGVPHEVPQIRGVEDRSSRSRDAAASDDAQSPGVCRPQGKMPTKSRADLHHGASWRCHRHLFAGWGRKRGVRDRDVRSHDYECPDGTTGDDACTPDSHASHGRYPAEGDSSPRDRPAEERLSDEEAGDPIATSVHEETVFLHKLISQITHEFNEVKQRTRAIGPRWTLGEIFSSEKSPLTHQVNQMNAQAFRFGYQQGDLETSQGREKLFTMVCRHRPKHLWYSPTCGPWSSWTNLNASRSLFHENLYQQKRHDLLYQVALGIVLFRHQVSHGDHFHWEQPGRSLMFQLSQMSEVHRYTMACELDLCRAGELKDPQNQKLIKKSLVILTTSREMYLRFHGLKCQHDHEHQSLEGSTCTSQGRMLRTQFSEVYPRKFARAAAHVLMKNQREWPVNWQPGMLALNEGEPCLVLGSARKTGPPKFVRSEVVFPEPRASPEAKRRKLTGKQSELPSLESFQQIIQTISMRAPRVGKMEITDSEIVTDLQNLFPQKLIQRVIACRGTDRTLGPPLNMMSQEAPYRRSLMVIRSTGKVAAEKHWERWDQLSKRQLIRPAHACRLNITMFGSDHPSSPEASSSSNEAGVPPMPVEPTPDSLPSTADRATSQPAEPEDMPGLTDDAVPKMPPEINRSQQGLRFKMLPKWEQQWLLRVHKNLGHPSNDRLVKALQMQGAHPGLVQAAQELACQICKSQEPPKNARPARLKPMLDFNHRIYLDGIDWTNSQGKTYHMYHILDAGSNYHVAVAAPAKSTESLIDIINKNWISWAGPPCELFIDAGTEMNSAAFEQFTSRFGIKCSTSEPDSHWKNGRIERHGRFLQEMLTKVDLEYPIRSYHDLQSGLNQCTHSKNSLSVRKGYAPEIIVFGKHSRLPGSILSDESIPSHMNALSEEAELQPSEFKQMLMLREAARRAYHAADNSDVLRRASVHRSCPSRGMFHRGEWVMLWRLDQNQEPPRHRWYGPLRVIIQDGNQTVWCTNAGRLYRGAPEHVRRAVPEEGQPEGPDLPDDMTQIHQQIQNMSRGDNREESQPLIAPPENLDETMPQPTESPPPPNVDNDSQHIQTEGSLQQPEPESEGPAVDSANSQPSEEGSTEGDDPSLATINLVCTDAPGALQEPEAHGSAWRCEFEVNLPCPIHEHVPDEAESWALLATTAKKQRTEVRLSELTPAEKAQFAAAKDTEVQNWIKTGTISKVLRNQIPDSQIMKCRWILTWKETDPDPDAPNQAKGRKAKARVVILGFMDPSLENIPRDSPTLGRTSKMIALQLVSSHKWTLQSFDVKAAFLQGKPQENRLIIIDPVPELRRAMSMTQHELARLNKGAYGLVDAPFLWYCTLVEELTKLNFEPSPMDPCLFVLRHPSDGQQPGRLAGVVGIHVDDGIGGGDTYFNEQIQKLEKKFPFGSHKTSGFTFTGIDVQQHGDFSITLSQSKYVCKIPPIKIEVNRKTQPELPVTEEEKLALRGLIGSL